MTDTEQVVAAYWAAAEARDWPTFGALVAEDMVYEAPQSRERVRGRAAYLRFNEEGFPGEWHLAVRRIVAGRYDAASVIEMSSKVGIQHGLCFFEIDQGGLISRITDFWPEPYDPPPQRRHLAERY
jgi:hypothetical protein